LINIETGFRKFWWISIFRPTGSVSSHRQSARTLHRASHFTRTPDNMIGILDVWPLYY